MFKKYSSRILLYIILTLLTSFLMFNHGLWGMLFMLALLLLIYLSAIDNLTDEIGIVVLLCVVSLIGGVFILFGKHFLGIVLAMLPLCCIYGMACADSYKFDSTKAEFPENSNQQSWSKTGRKRKRANQADSIWEDINSGNCTNKSSTSDVDPTLD